MNIKLLVYSLSAFLTGGTGVVLSTLNYENKEETYLFRELKGVSDQSSRRKRSEDSGSSSFNITASDGKKFHEFEVVRHSYKDLIRGTKSYNDGNYLLYYGSEACIHCMQFLFANDEVHKGTLNVNDHKMSEGALMKTYQFIREHDSLKDKKIKVIWFEDEPVSSDNRTNDDLWTLPWNTWSTTNLEKKQVQGEYKRYDKSATNMRKIMSYASEVFGHSKVPGTPTIIIYKNGVPKVFGSDKLDGLENNEKTSSKDSHPLKKYILYYFNKEKYDLTTVATKEK